MRRVEISLGTGSGRLPLDSQNKFLPASTFRPSASFSNPLCTPFRCHMAGCGPPLKALPFCLTKAKVSLSPFVPFLPSGMK